MSGDCFELLKRGLRELGLPASAGQLQQLRVYLQELERWNRVYGFVKAAGRELVVRHLLDSLSGYASLSRIARREQVLDVGSGAGFPGFPLAVFLTDSRFTLLERSAKKAAFLRNVAILTRLQNLSVEEKRLKDLERRFDLVLLRAFGPLQREIPRLRKLLKPGGSIAAYKGRLARIHAELEAAGISPGQALVEALQVPFLEEERHLVVLA
jgi:16S rRNA (guanine527-N7)-methyltransferase